MGGLEFRKEGRNQVVESRTSYSEESGPSWEVRGSYYRVYKERKGAQLVFRKKREAELEKGQSGLKGPVKGGDPESRVEWRDVSKRTDRDWKLDIMSERVE